VGVFDTTQLGLEQAISGAALRQRAIANNIANANTAGYKRVDVDFHAALDQALSAPDPKAQLKKLTFDTTTDTSTSTRADGNNVDIDAEMANLSQNSLEYQSLVQVARARMQMLQIAMGTRQA
jgi:flagellar basal-body rod protein FlgB